MFDFYYYFILTDVDAFNISIPLLKNMDARGSRFSLLTYMGAQLSQNSLFIDVDA